MNDFILLDDSPTLKDLTRHQKNAVVSLLRSCLAVSIDESLFRKEIDTILSDSNRVGYNNQDDGGVEYFDTDYAVREIIVLLKKHLPVNFK